MARIGLISPPGSTLSGDVTGLFTNDAIAAGAVTTTKIAAGAVTAARTSWAFTPMKVFNAEDYGAVGDGITDDAAALQATIDACAAAKGGTVVLMNKQYLITKRLSLRGASNGSALVPPLSNGISVSIVGTGSSIRTSGVVGYGTSVIVNASGDSAIWARSASSSHTLSAIHLRDFTVVNTVALPSDTFTIDCLGVVEGLEIANIVLELRNLQGNGLRHSTFNSGGTIRNVTVANCPGDGSPLVDDGISHGGIGIEITDGRDGETGSAIWATYTDGAISLATPTTLTMATSTPFTAADVGKSITVAGAGVAGAGLTTTIAAYVAANQVTLTAAASTAVSGATVTVVDGWTSQSNGLSMSACMVATCRLGYIFRGYLQSNTVIGCRVEGNTASHGFWCRGQSPTGPPLSANFFAGLWAESFGFGGGSCAGLYMDSNCIGNVVNGAYLVSGSGAYGIYCNGARNRFVVNVSGTSAVGLLPVGVYLDTQAAGNAFSCSKTNYVTSTYTDVSTAKTNVNLDLPPGTVAARIQNVADQTSAATTEATATQIGSVITVNADGSTIYRIEFECPYAFNSNATENDLWLYDNTGGGAASIGRLGTFDTTTAGKGGPIRRSYEIKLAAGSHTLSVRASVGAGTVTFKAGAGGAGIYTPIGIRAVVVGIG